jgi:hypothetical protein
LTANASASNNASYTEAGYLYLAPGAFRDDSYTSVDQPNGDCVTDTTGDANLSDALVSNKYGCSIGNKTNYSLGRFIPDHFALIQDVVTPACGGFTYFSQDGFSTLFALVAQNSANAVTQNYSGSFARLGLTTWSNFVFTSAGLPVGSALTASATAPTGSWSNGVAVVSAKHQVSRPTALTGETSVTVKAAPVDADGVTMPAAQVAAGTPLRYGRLRLSNVYGSVPPLQMPVEAQYWSGNSWVKNGDDNCTPLVGGNLLLTPSGWTAVPGAFTGGSGAIALTPTAPGSIKVCADLGPDNGVACPATSASLPWLQSKWPGGTGYNNDPSATATFGIFSPEGRKGVYNRELY